MASFALWRKIRALLPEEIRGWSAGLYERLAAPGFAPFYRDVASLAAEHLACGRVLDVGTGPGRLLPEIARRNRRLRLVGLDLSREMLRIASSGSQAGDIGGAQFVRANVGRLPFSDGVFDLVVSTSSLHHWRDPATGIRECFRVTRPGGECWIYDLRTDVGVLPHARAIPGGRMRRGLLGLVFRFHGVRAADFSNDTVAQWLSGAQVRVDLSETHVRLVLRKAPCAARHGLAVTAT